MEEYSAKLTGEPFLYRETKIIGDYLQQGFEASELKKKNIEENLNKTHGFVMAERLMAELTWAGMGKQTAYAIVRKNAIKANKEKVLLSDLILADEEACKLLSKEEVQDIMNPHTYIGSAEIIVSEIVESSKNWF